MMMLGKKFEANSGGDKPKVIINITQVELNETWKNLLRI